MRGGGNDTRLNNYHLNFLIFGIFTLFLYLCIYFIVFIEWEAGHPGGPASVGAFAYIYGFFLMIPQFILLLISFVGIFFAFIFFLKKCKKFPTILSLLY